MEYIWETAEEMDLALARRVRAIRKRKGMTQAQLSKRSNVSFGSIKRFETTGQISLISLTKIAVALGSADEIRNLFTNVAYQSIEEVLNAGKQA